MMGCMRKEPDLNDLFADPIVQAVMSRDSVQEQELRGLIDRVRLSLGPDMLGVVREGAVKEHVCS
jgi:hypothetical protein